MSLDQAPAHALARERQDGTRETGGSRRAAARSGTARACFAGAIAAIGWTALAIDFGQLLLRFRAVGRSPFEAALAYLRYFTILTNGGVAVLMSVTAFAWLWPRLDPRPGLFRAALVYMAVTGLTYEGLLRGLWSPTGLQFWTDLTFHDIQPALTLLFWASAAPKQGLRWTTLPWLLVYPAVYFVVTLTLGAVGAGYTYPFLDAARLGAPAVCVVGVVFMAAFLGLGAAITVAAPLLNYGRSPPACR